MASCGFVLLAASLLAADAPAVETAADVLTLRDGQVVLGQVVEPAPRGTVLLLVRRSWAEAEVPDWYARWSKAEMSTNRRARLQRLDRLRAWRRSRGPFVAADDSILRWIDGELARLGDPSMDSDSKLMRVRLSRGEVRSSLRRPPASARWLRLGWLSGFPGVENMALDRLEEALEGRGFLSDGEGTVSVEGLLPLPVETEGEWANRRAATEVINDPGLKFVRTGSILLPEPEPGQALELGGAVSALNDLGRLLDGKATDPLAEALSKVAARGRVGAVVTELEIPPDLTTVRVRSTLWVRRAERWGAAGARTAVVRSDELAANAGAPLADDPQVKGVFNLVESLGLGPVPEELKKRSLNIGAATQKALRQVRTLSLEDLNGLALPVHEVPAKESKP